MTAPTMLLGLAEIAAQPVTRTTAGELPPHVKPGRTWRNTRSDEHGTWHLPADRSDFANAVCGAFAPSPGRAVERWYGEGDEPASACRRCLAKAAQLDAMAADEASTNLRSLAEQRHTKE